MRRARRCTYPGALHHIAVNGNNRRSMFVTDDDRRILLSILRVTSQRYGWDVKSYCLMDTHWHALLRTPEPNLAAGMQRMNTVYSRGFNLRHGRTGHSIRHRYMSVLVEDERHLIELTRYIPLNPVRGGLASHPEDWPWSNYRAELGFSPRPAWLDTHWAMRAHGSVAALRRFVAAGVAEPGARWTPGSDPTLTPPRPEE
jgi:putative transposase